MYMKLRAITVLLACTLASAACTTLRPIEASPDEVQRQLLSGQLVQPGDRVRLVTRDEAVHEFRVTEVDLEQGLLIGKDSRVPIADVIAVETRDVSVGKTALLVGGVGYGIGALIAILIAPAVILGAG